MFLARTEAGKSHLMSVLSSIAENEKLLDHITEPKVRAAAKADRRRFKVIRAELGTTGMSLHDAVTTELEQSLADIGVTFRFPPIEEITNYKKAFEDMMDAFSRGVSQSRTPSCRG